MFSIVMAIIPYLTANDINNNICKAILVTAISLRIKINKMVSRALTYTGPDDGYRQVFTLCD